MSETETTDTTATATDAGADAGAGALEPSVLMYIPVKDIEVRENLARFFKPDAKRLKELEDSIREQGLLEPIGVKANDNGGAPYVLQYGEQRLTQFKKVFGDDAEIPAVVRPDSSDSLKDAAAENLGQNRLTSVEKNLLVQRVRKAYGWEGPENTKKVADYLKMSVTSVTQYERIGKLATTPTLQKALHKDELSDEGGLELSRIHDPKLREEFFKRAQDIEVEAEKARAAEAKEKAEAAAERAAKIKADADASEAAKKKAALAAAMAKKTAKDAEAKVAATAASGKPKKVTAPAVRQAMNEGGVATTPSKPAQARTSTSTRSGSGSSKTDAKPAAGAAKQRNISAWVTMVQLMGKPEFGSKRASRFSKAFENWYGTGTKSITDAAFVTELRAVFAD